jgi:hypothetical protein
VEQVTYAISVNHQGRLTADTERVDNLGEALAATQRALDTPGVTSVVIYPVAIDPSYGEPLYGSH